tara:strand:+ start:4048 stop:5688 length:1641 start_codon:yes stop_codon:yes gene_type:complete
MPALISSGQLFNTHVERIEDVINKNIDIMLPGVDPIWENMVTSSMGVGPVDALGREYKILKVFMGGLTGIFEQGRSRNDFALFGDATDETFGDRLFQQQVTQSFPDALDGMNQKPYRFGLPMRTMVANIAFTLGELQAEASPAFIGQIVAPKLEGFSRNIAQTLCNSWYTSQNDGYVLSSVTSKSTSGSGPYYLEFEPGNKAIDRFMVGQQLDIYEDSSGSAIGQARRNESAGVRQVVVVDFVDEITNTVRLVSNVDAFSSVVNTDVIVHANSHYTDSGAKFTNIAGINSFLKGGDSSASSTMFNTLLGTVGGSASAAAAGESIFGEDINVNERPEHKSLFRNLNSSLLTEHTLRQILRRFHAAKAKHGQTIDTLVASDGVWLGYESTKIGREILDRTGRLSSLATQGSEGGSAGGANDQFNSGFNFTMDGKSYTGYTSCYVEEGTMYGLKMGGGNYKKYVPPSISGTSSFDQGPAFAPFEFVAGALTGTGTNQLPIYTNAGGRNFVTEASQMPGYLRMQVCPDQFAGLKVVGITEDRIYGQDQTV